jgi:hypothetical protein
MIINSDDSYYQRLLIVGLVIIINSVDSYYQRSLIVRLFNSK